MELWEFMRDNLPFAFYGNTRNEYSDEEFQIAHSCLDPHSSKLNDIDIGLLTKGFACLIRSIKYVKNEYDTYYSIQIMKGKGEEWRQYHAMIFEFNRVLKCFSYGFEGEIARFGKTFQIKEVIFKGKKTDQKIILKGKILELLEAMFRSFNSVYSESDKQRMREFSSELYDAYQEFNKEWIILNAESGTFAKKLIQNREEKNKETAFNRYRNEIAFKVHTLFKKHDNSSVKIPEWHKQFIGELFISCGIAHNENENTPGFIGTSYNAVRRWIEEGEKAVN